MINIIDYNMGNLRSVQKAFERIGIPAKITANADEIAASRKLVLPGVGHFSKAVKILKSNGLFEALNQAVQIKKIPILGICLGMQLMAEFSEEGSAKGFGWIKAEVSRFSFLQKNLRIPHMGWNKLFIQNDDTLFKGIDTDNFYYFVHSYFIECANQGDVLSETDYGNTFVSAFQHENIFGCQFHPEKSHDAGLKILKNFAEL
jgi:imidazole glycerol-phosphate synthase subunit HisH